MKLLDFHKIFKFDDMRRWKRVNSTARTVSSSVSNADQDSLYRKTMYEFQDSWIRRIPPSLAYEWWNIIVTVEHLHKITRVLQPFSLLKNIKKSMQKCDIIHNSFHSVMTSPSNWVRDYKNYYIIYFITYYIISDTWVNLLRNDWGSPFLPPPCLRGFWHANIFTFSCCIWNVLPSSGTYTSALWSKQAFKPSSTDCEARFNCK